MDNQVKLTTKQLKINDQLTMLANNYNLISYANIVVGGLTVYVLWGVVEQTVLSGWYAVVVFMMLGRHLIKNRFLTSNITTPNLLNKWQVRFITMSLVAGIWWGIGAWLFIMPQYPQLVTFIAVSWIGMVAGTIGSQGVHLPSFIAYCLPTMLALSIRIITIGGESYVILGFFALSLTMGFLGFARANYKTVVESLNLRYQKDELVNELATKNDDLSEQMAKVELANKQKSQFLAAASHDLRQPLQSLQLFIEILRTQLTTTQSQETLSRVEGSTMALQELLNALLDISRLEAGDVNKHVKNISLKPMLEELVASNQRLASNNDITLSLINTSTCVATDGVLLHRCLNNLIVNAIAHSRGSKVTIGVRRRKNHIDVLVIDNGIGISEADQEEIFLEFHQLQNPERDRRKGLGLGLAIVKRTCDILSHPLVLKSRPQRGSNFIIRLPRVTHQEVMPRAQVSQSSANLSLTIWVLDDEIEIREGLETLLHTWGATVEIAGSKHDVEQLLIKAKFQPALIISDYRFPHEVTGVELIDSIRNHFKLEIPAILITGDTAPERINEARNSGLMLLHKPLRPAKLRMAINKVT